MQPHQKTLFEGYPTYEALLKDLSPEKLIVAFAGIEYIENSISKRRVSLEDLTELYSISKMHYPGVNYVTLWIEYLAKYINVKPLIETRATAFMIYKSYKHFYLTDMKLLLEKISKADYGRDSLFFGCIDVQRLSYCFAMYNEERNRIANKYYQKIEKDFSKIKEQVESEEKERIYNELAKDYKDKELWAKYEQRCNDEIPIKIKSKLEEFINNQGNDSKEK